MLDALLVKIFRYPRVSATLVGGLVLVLAGTIWWQFMWQSPQRVFMDMLVNNLETTSVTKHASAANQAQSVDQYVRLAMGSTNATDWLVDAQQGNSMVESESIGTPTTGYIRYVHIAANQTSAKPYNFSPALNVWGKADGTTDPNLNQLFGQTLLDISNAPLPPIANLPASERADLLQFIAQQKVFNPAYNTVKRQTIAGRSVYTYTVAVPLEPYVRLMQVFAHDVGLTSLDTVDPTQYAATAPVQLTLSVDRHSHQLVQAAYAQTGFSQTYGSWGLLVPIALPQHTISTTDLQQRIQSAVTHVI